MPTNPGRKQAEKVLKFPETKHQLLRSFITQRELMEERVLAREATRFAKQLEQKRADIRRRLEAGVPVEDGSHTAYLRSYYRKPHRVRGKNCVLLVVR